MLAAPVMKTTATPEYQESAALLKLRAQISSDIETLQQAAQRLKEFKPLMGR